MIEMGLDQLIKVIIKKVEPNEDDSTDGVYKEFYFRKNYYLQKEIGKVYYDNGLNNDNMVYFHVDTREFFKLYDQVNADLEKAEKGLITGKDYGDHFDADNSWLIMSICKVKQLFEEMFKLYDKYPEHMYDFEILYWQWY